MSDAPRRRWFRFDLRTMFVAVALLAVSSSWIYSQWRLIHDRSKTWKEIESAGGTVAATHPGDVAGVTLPNLNHVSPRRPLSWIRTIMGDLPVMVILLVPARPDIATVDRVKSLFPEAVVIQRSEWFDRR